MDVSRAQISNAGNSVILVDPRWPYTLTVQMFPNSNRPEISKLEIQSRDGHAITGEALSQIPIRQLARVCASELMGEGEAQYRMLARPRPSGARGWPPDHYQRVARVASWARATGRRGGGAGAVAEFWGVHYRTARRWLSRRPPA
jgi:hypothetical protein